jgi:hypothetical protein
MSGHMEAGSNPPVAGMHVCNNIFDVICTAQAPRICYKVLVG